MSRIGKKIIDVPKGVTIANNAGAVTVKGPKGELSFSLDKTITMQQKDSQVWFERSGDDKRVRALHGLSRAVIANMVVGVTVGFRKELDLEGVGYRVAQEGKNLKFQLGYSHDIDFPALAGVLLKAEGQSKVVVEGIDRQLVGQVAANIRSLRPVEPYKGKGIRYNGEKVRRKEGKSAKK